MDGEIEGSKDSGRKGGRLGGTAIVRNKENERHPEGSREVQEDLSRKGRGMST